MKERSGAQSISRPSLGPGPTTWSTHLVHPNAGYALRFTRVRDSASTDNPPPPTERNRNDLSRNEDQQCYTIFVSPNPHYTCAIAISYNCYTIINRIKCCFQDASVENTLVTTQSLIIRLSWRCNDNICWVRNETEFIVTDFRAKHTLHPIIYS